MVAIKQLGISQDWIFKIDDLVNLILFNWIYVDQLGILQLDFSGMP